MMLDFGAKFMNKNEEKSKITRASINLSYLLASLLLDQETIQLRLYKPFGNVV